MTSRPDTETVPSLWALLALHFVPGIALFVVYLALASRLAARGLPASFTLHLCFAVVGIPLMLGLLRALGRRESGRRSIGAALRFRRRLTGWQYALAVPLFLVYAIAVTVLLAPVTSVLQAWLATWVPAGWIDPNAGLVSVAVAPWLLFAVRLAIDGVANPIVEELYFRGYLLPRMAALGRAAPAVHGALFAMAHLWQLQNVPALAAMVIPLYYVVWRLRSLRLGIAVHCAANIVGSLLSLPA